MNRLPPDPLEHAKLATLKLLTVFTVEQLIQLSEAAVVTRDNAVIRKCGQSFQVDINDKGYVRYFHYHQSVEAVKPRNDERTVISRPVGGVLPVELEGRDRGRGDGAPGEVQQ